MNNKLRKIIAIAASYLLLLQGCATISSEPFLGAGDKQSGMRFYEPTPFLIVTNTKIQTVMIPNPNRGVAINFKNWLAKHNAELEMDQGSLKSIKSEADSTAIPTGFLTMVTTLGGKALDTAIEAAKSGSKVAGAMGDTIDGTIINKEGVYEFKFDKEGNFVGLRKLEL